MNCEETYAFSLPLPPSVNHMYVGLRRHKSKFYKDWLNESWLSLVATHPSLPHGKGRRWELTVTCVMPNWRRRDVDNVLKPLIDLLADFFGLEDNYLIAIAAVKEVVSGESHCEGEVRLVG